MTITITMLSLRCLCQAECSQTKPVNSSSLLYHHWSYV